MFESFLVREWQATGGQTLWVASDIGYERSHRVCIEPDLVASQPGEDPLVPMFL